MLQSQNVARVFLYECKSEENRLSAEKFNWHFYLILNVMPDKVVFERSAALCTAIIGEVTIFCCSKIY